MTENGRIIRLTIHSAYDMLDLIAEKTAAQGMDRYEVSAFAKSGHRCRHNLNYWGFGDYLGIGAGAHSKLSFAEQILRQSRVREGRPFSTSSLAFSESWTEPH